MKLTAVAALAALGTAVSGCATIVEGTTQSVSVNTAPVQGAQCTLTNSQGTWYATTPGSVVVHKTKTDLDVTCDKQGYAPGHVVATSHFAATTAGNLVFGLVGAPVGAGVDAASGANYHYDSPIYVPLGANLASGEASSPFPVSVHCSSPALAATLTPDGPDGFVTARVQFDINTTGDANAVQVAPAKNGVCAVSALEGIAIRSVSFEIDPAASSTSDTTPKEIEKHIEVAETLPDNVSATGQTYTFTVKAKDTTAGKLTLRFPIRYR